MQPGRPVRVGIGMGWAAAVKTSHRSDDTRARLDATEQLSRAWVC